MTRGYFGHDVERCRGIERAMETLGLKQERERFLQKKAELTQSVDRYLQPRGWSVY